MTHIATILLIDDEKPIRLWVRAALVGHHYQVIEAGSAQEALRVMRTHPPDLIILDLILPDKDAIQVLKELRVLSSVPVIAVSTADSERIKIEALESGADDYLSKPFTTSQLLKRIETVLSHRLSGKSIGYYKKDQLLINLDSHTVMLNGEAVHLNATELALLKCLVESQGKIVTYQQLLESVWGNQAATRGQYLRIHMQHLRQKLKDDVLDPHYIISETGIGYRLLD